MSVILPVISSLCIAAAVFCASYFVLETALRLELDKGGALSGAEEDVLKKRRSLPMLFRMMLVLLPNVRKYAENDFFAAARAAAGEKLQMAGYADVFSGTDFVGLRILFALLGMIFLIVSCLAGKVIFGLIFLLLFCIYPVTWLNARVKKRHWEIMRALPNVLDLLTLSVEAGKDFMSSLSDILARRRHDALTEELSRVFHEVRLGRKRSEALRDMSERVRQADLSSVVNAIIQAEELGVSIGQLLRIQGDMLRSKRFARAEKLANEAPVKIIFPVIVFIFPALLIVLAVPVFISVAKIFS